MPNTYRAFWSLLSCKNLVVSIYFRSQNSVLYTLCVSVLFFVYWDTHLVFEHGSTSLIFKNSLSVIDLWNWGSLVSMLTASDVRTGVVAVLCLPWHISMFYISCLFYIMSLTYFIPVLCVCVCWWGEWWKGRTVFPLNTASLLVTKCVDIFPYWPNFQHQLGVLQFTSVPTPSTWS